MANEQGKTEHDDDPKANADKWIQMTPGVRVLLEMPEEDALWLRRHIAKNRENDYKKRHAISVVDSAEDESLRLLEMRILEILIYG